MLMLIQLNYLRTTYTETAAAAAVALFNGTSVGHTRVSVEFAYFVNPLRILRTLSTMTASIPSATCCYLKISRGSRIGYNRTNLYFLWIVVENSIADTYEAIILDDLD